MGASTAPVICQVNGSPCSETTGRLRRKGTFPETRYGPLGWTLMWRSSAMTTPSFHPGRQRRPAHPGDRAPGSEGGDVHDRVGRVPVAIGSDAGVQLRGIDERLAWYSRQVSQTTKTSKMVSRVSPTVKRTARR